MNETLRILIDAAILENDLGALGNLLCEHERDDAARVPLYEAIDRVTANMARPLPSAGMSFRERVIESAYHRENDEIADAIVALDEELAGVRPPVYACEAWTAETKSKLEYWLEMASANWTK